METSFKNETVGLTTREEFMQKRATMADRSVEAALQKKKADEEEVQKAKEKRKRDKHRKLTSKLSFADDDEVRRPKPRKAISLRKF